MKSQVVATVNRRGRLEAFWVANGDSNLQGIIPMTTAAVH